MDFFLFLTFKHKNHKIELEIWIHILILKTCKLIDLSMKISTCNYMLLIKIILLYFTGFKGLSSLKKLEILDISGNEFDKSDLKSLGAISSLKTLALCSMGWDGSFPIQGMLYVYIVSSKLSIAYF